MSYAQGGAAYRIRRNRAYKRLHGQVVSVNRTETVAITTSGVRVSHYSIRLTATNASGSDTKTSTNYISVTH